MTRICSIFFKNSTNRCIAKNILYCAVLFHAVHSLSFPISSLFERRVLNTIKIKDTHLLRIIEKNRLIMFAICSANNNFVSSSNNTLLFSIRLFITQVNTPIIHHRDIESDHLIISLCLCFKTIQQYPKRQ